MNKADHSFVKTFTSCDDRNVDISIVIVSYLISHGFLKDDFEKWYESGKMTLEVKEEVKELPVFCRNEQGGHHGVMSSNVWFGQYACKAISKAFKKANIAVSVSAYSLRRNFIQAAQLVTDDKKTAVLAGHQPQSVVQYTKYGNTFDTLDVVRLVKESKFSEIELNNDYVTGLRCTVQVYKKLSKEEYEQEVECHLVEEKEKLQSNKKELKKKYVSLEKAYSQWTKEEKVSYTSIYKSYKNKQDVYRRKVFKKLATERREAALSEMRVDESGQVIEEEEEEQLEFFNEERETAVEPAVSTSRSAQDARFKDILHASKTATTRLEGTHHCMLCLQDQELKSKSKTLYGHSAHVLHVFQGFVTPSWGLNKSNKRGQHTEVAKYLRDNQAEINQEEIKCSVCDRAFRGKRRNDSYTRHMKIHYESLNIADLKLEEAKKEMIKYFVQHFNVEIQEQELNDLINTRRKN